MLTRTFLFLLLLVSLPSQRVLACNGVDRDALLSFYHHFSFPRNSPSGDDCCQWPGVSCADYQNHGRRVTHLWLPERNLTGVISPFLSKLSFLSNLNLSHNLISGTLPLMIFRSLKRLQVVDLSFNLISGPLAPPLFAGRFHSWIRVLNLSNNKLNGSIDSSFLYGALSLSSLNVSGNSFTGPIPSSICTSSPLVEILDFSNNQFGGQFFLDKGICSNLQVLRAGSNSLTGGLPEALNRMKNLTEISLPDNQLTGPINKSIGSLSKLRILELHDNGLTGELPRDIGLLSDLEQLLLYNNHLNGTILQSLTNCSNLANLLLRDNQFTGEIADLDFSNLQRLKTIDLGNNSLHGGIPDSLCSCRSLIAIRLAFNRLDGEIPTCMASLSSLMDFAVSYNLLSNVTGALKTLRHSDNLAVLFMSSNFQNEIMPDDEDLLHLSSFQNLQILTLGGCGLSGHIPSWIGNLKKLKVLNLSYNNISGPIPTWLADMPSLFDLNFTHNQLSGYLPQEIGSLPALISDNSGSDLSYLALPFFANHNQYTRLANVQRGLKIGKNSLSGNIPKEIGQLKLLQVLDLSNNSFNGSIPDQLSSLSNLETLDISSNHLSGQIPDSLSKLNFLSSFSVAENDLIGEIPNGGQFDTFSAAAFKGNPELCGYQLKKSCLPIGQFDTPVQKKVHESSWFNLAFGVGIFPRTFFCSSSHFLAPRMSVECKYREYSFIS